MVVTDEDTVVSFVTISCWRGMSISWWCGMFWNSLRSGNVFSIPPSSMKKVWLPSTTSSSNFEALLLFFLITSSVCCFLSCKSRLCWSFSCFSITESLVSSWISYRFEVVDWAVDVVVVDCAGVLVGSVVDVVVEGLEVVVSGHSFVLHVSRWDGLTALSQYRLPLQWTFLYLTPPPQDFEHWNES